MHTYMFICKHVCAHTYGHVLLNYQWGNASLGGFVAVRAHSAVTQTSMVRPTAHLLCVESPLLLDYKPVQHVTTQSKRLAQAQEKKLQ